MPDAVAQADQIERRHHLLAALPRGQGQQQQRQFDVLVRRQHGHQMIELENEAHVPRPPAGQLAFGHRRDQLLAHPDLPLAWLVESGNQIQQRRLAGTTGAHQAQKFAFRDIQRQVVQDVQSLAAAFEVAMYAVNAYDPTLLGHRIPSAIGLPNQAHRRTSHAVEPDFMAAF